MDAEVYLTQIGLNNAIIIDKQNSLIELYALATSITAPMGTEPVQTSSISDKVGKFGTEIVYLRQKIEEDIIRLKTENMQRIKHIEQVGDELQYKVLYKHYVDGLKFNRIAELLGYSEVWISTQHQNGLAKVQEILDLNNE